MKALLIITICFLAFTTSIQADTFDIEPEPSPAPQPVIHPPIVIPPEIQAEINQRFPGFVANRQATIKVRQMLQAELDAKFPPPDPRILACAKYSGELFLGTARISELVPDLRSDSFSTRQAAENEIVELFTDYILDHDGRVACDFWWRQTGVLNILKRHRDFACGTGYNLEACTRLRIITNQIAALENR